MGAIGLPELILVMSFIVIPFLMFITALVQVLSSTFQEPTNKILWVVVILFAPFIGPILWWCIGTKQRVGR
jgi:ABC-type transport system involved in Fe-S cluster assembly fused permease/ATPase subunit